MLAAATVQAHYVKQLVIYNANGVTLFSSTYFWSPENCERNRKRLQDAVQQYEDTWTVACVPMGAVKL